MGGFFGTISNSSCATDLFTAQTTILTWEPAEAVWQPYTKASSNALSIIWKILISVLV